MKLYLTFALAFSMSLPAARFDVAHVAKLSRVSDPQISPDGKSIVIVVARPNYDENRYDSELVMVDVASRQQRVLTHDRHSVSSPRWSPSGDRLAFLSPVSGKLQILVMPMNGGDAGQLTKSSTGVQQFAWSPDGATIAFAASDEAPKRTGDEKFNDSFEIGDDDYLVTAAALPTHLWTIPAAGGEARRLTSGTWTMPISHPPGSPASPISWSPDGKFIAFVKVVNPHSGDSDQSTLQILDVASGSFRAVTGRNRHEGYPVYSPDGSKLAYWYPRDGQTKFGDEIFVAPSSGGEGADVTRAIDRNLQRAIWMPDGKSLLVGGNDGTTTGLWIQPLEGPARRVPLGKIVPASAFWVDAAVGHKGEIAFTGSEPLHPAELYYLPSATGSATRLTDFNREVAALELGKTETVEWDFEGFHEDGVVTYPPDFTASRKYPLVLYVHGGPRAASKEAFSSRAQLLAAQGWVVFEPNYRGSDDLGNAYQGAIWGDAGAGPGRDTMAGVDLLKKRGFVDESRMAVSGWSYGGYMTTWLLGHYPMAWKVAIAGAPVTNWVDQYNLGDGNVRRAPAFGGSPYVDNHMAAYLEQSPITEIGKSRAPTLIMSDTGDYRVPITQAFELYHNLKDHGVTTKFIAYPVPGHSPADPVRQRDIDRRWIDWLREFLAGGPSQGGGQ